MSIQQLKVEAAGLPDAQRRELIGYLITVGRERNPPPGIGSRQKLWIAIGLIGCAKKTSPALAIATQPGA